ncbi:PulJ/GspJ family protein [Oligoflexus tunisiensis]|uniref:PulJ/GspJ family protein n=1 Tax=Oligoflexus tunisiensis TaxID=708132 RepID=UPI00159F2C5F|nr:prepilin-type N-terminal cleavage/methylation domain-containing protein [Oligoflexus tunisiensis]
MKIQSNYGFTLIEMLVGIVIMGFIALGARHMMLRAHEGTLREGLRKNHAELSQELTRRLNYYFKRHTSRMLAAPHRLVMTLPSGQVVVETACVKNEIDYQAHENLLNRCVTCKSTERPVIRIQAQGAPIVIPGLKQKPDLPAAASICFRNGADPDEVEVITEQLVVDPINRQDRKVSKSESFLIKDSSKLTSFE